MLIEMAAMEHEVGGPPGRDLRKRPQRGEGDVNGRRLVEDQKRGPKKSDDIE